ncbi:hypothetical protein [Pseudomonas sp. Marseille-Q5115]|uniref:hypothetical protein n=1 Tax=Pseudomonas sp. Marseille-Q5115 TaxID=2866593 RepID=UPI001CE405BE|nr:hypothetical protein [Pseudomonas sp. Marseille-Q5115]
MNNQLPTNNMTDYRSTLETAAMDFLRRNHHQHLSTDQELVNRTTDHLRKFHGVEENSAAAIAGRVHETFSAAGGHRYLDIANSNESTAVLTDPATGLTYRLPVALIFRVLIDDPGPLCPSGAH